MSRISTVCIAAVMLSFPLALAGQGRFYEGASHGNASYDGRFVFARIRYGGWNSSWNHDYPRADRHLTYNDPTGRMMALANHDNDLAELWEWSGTGLFPVDFTNEAYKLGVNYVIYAMTH